MKAHYSGKIETELLNKLDMVALNDQRSRAFFLERALVEFIERHEKAHGAIKVDARKLDAFRNRRKAG